MQRFASVTISPTLQKHGNIRQDVVSAQGMTIEASIVSHSGQHLSFARPSVSTRMAPGAGDSGMDHALFSDGTMESSKGGFSPIAFSASPSPPPHLPFSPPPPDGVGPGGAPCPAAGVVVSTSFGGDGGREKPKKRRHDIITATPPPAASNSPTTNLFRRHWASFDALDVLFKPVPATTAVNKFEPTIHCNAKIVSTQVPTADITFRPTSHYAAKDPLTPSLPTSSCVLFSLAPGYSQFKIASAASTSLIRSCAKA
ncbi:uncharacterized protein CLUP02_07818 [Colletotrichum lupini]|uniref:Uncharacterized protein n=1 Tax=Colletotrichum lupini TaxID=145971 RepID=A0A9Q8SSM1_9PEZI|nr:uncharacterized protein CLUP02_07818 [Colletotrichum lupini]UQC82330.1 hypothetical protein CLUP02_07818 [Colletotrichum lupini]